MLAALAGSAPILQPAIATTVLAACEPGSDLSDTLGDVDADDWRSELLKRLSLNLRSFSIIGFGRCDSNRAEEC